MNAILGCVQRMMKNEDKNGPPPKAKVQEIIKNEDGAPLTKDTIEAALVRLYNKPAEERHADWGRLLRMLAVRGIVLPDQVYMLDIDSRRKGAFKVYGKYKGKNAKGEDIERIDSHAFDRTFTVIGFRHGVGFEPWECREADLDRPAKPAHIADPGPPPSF